MTHVPMKITRDRSALGAYGAPRAQKNRDLFVRARWRLLHECVGFWPATPSCEVRARLKRFCHLYQENV